MSRYRYRPVTVTVTHRQPPLHTVTDRPLLLLNVTERYPPLPLQA